MLFLIMAILCSSCITLIFRYSDGRYGNRYAMLCSNYITCIIVAVMFLGRKGSILPVGGEGMLALKLGAVNGLLYLLGLVLNQINVTRNGAIMTATFSRLGLLIPMLGSIFILKETPTPIQILGIILAVFAIIYTSTKGKQDKPSDGTVKYKAGLLLLLLVGGFADGMSKVFEHLGSRQWDSQFLLYTFFTAFILCTLLLIKSAERPKLADVLFGIAIGIPNYMSSRFALKALTVLPAYIVYPSVSICTILVVSIVSVLVFKEKPTTRQKLGVAIIMIAVALLNI